MSPFREVGGNTDGVLGKGKNDSFYMGKKRHLYNCYILKTFYSFIMLFIHICIKKLNKLMKDILRIRKINIIT